MHVNCPVIMHHISKNNFTFIQIINLSGSSGNLHEYWWQMCSQFLKFPKVSLTCERGCFVNIFHIFFKNCKKKKNVCRSANQSFSGIVL